MEEDLSDTDGFYDAACGILIQHTKAMGHPGKPVRHRDRPLARPSSVRVKDIWYSRTHLPVIYLDECWLGGFLDAGHCKIIIGVGSFFTFGCTYNKLPDGGLRIISIIGRWPC